MRSNKQEIIKESISSIFWVNLSQNKKKQDRVSSVTKTWKCVLSFMSRPCWEWGRYRIPYAEGILKMRQGPDVCFFRQSSNTDCLTPIEFYLQSEAGEEDKNKTFSLVRSKPNRKTYLSKLRDKRLSFREDYTYCEQASSTQRTDLHTSPCK